MNPTLPRRPPTASRLCHWGEHSSCRDGAAIVCTCPCHKRIHVKKGPQ